MHASFDEDEDEADNTNDRDRENCTVIVSNIPEGAVEGDLKRLFEDVSTSFLSFFLSSLSSLARASHIQFSLSKVRTRMTSVFSDLWCVYSSADTYICFCSVWGDTRDQARYAICWRGAESHRSDSGNEE